MTEKEVWLYLADEWDRAHIPPGGYYPAAAGANGICGCVDMMLLRRLITYRTFSDILKKINAIPDYNDFTHYKWPLTLEGAKQRAAFCRQQAEKCS